MLGLGLPHSAHGLPPEVPLGPPSVTVSRGHPGSGGEAVCQSHLPRTPWPSLALAKLSGARRGRALAAAAQEPRAQGLPGSVGRPCLGAGGHALGGGVSCSFARTRSGQRWRLREGRTPCGSCGPPAVTGLRQGPHQQTRARPWASHSCSHGGPAGRRPPAMTAGAQHAFGCPREGSLCPLARGRRVTGGGGGNGG